MLSLQGNSKELAEKVCCTWRIAVFFFRVRLIKSICFLTFHCCHHCRVSRLPSAASSGQKEKLKANWLWGPVP